MNKYTKLAEKFIDKFYDKKSDSFITYNHTTNWIKNFAKSLDERPKEEGEHPAMKEICICRHKRGHHGYYSCGDCVNCGGFKEATPQPKEEGERKHKYMFTSINGVLACGCGKTFKPKKIEKLELPHGSVWTDSGEKVVMHIMWDKINELIDDRNKQIK